MYNERTIDELFSVIRGVSFPKAARSENSEEYFSCLRTANIQNNIIGILNILTMDNKDEVLNKTMTLIINR